MNCNNPPKLTFSTIVREQLGTRGPDLPYCIVSAAADTECEYCPSAVKAVSLRHRDKAGDIR